LQSLEQEDFNEFKQRGKHEEHALNACNLGKYLRTCSKAESNKEACSGRASRIIIFRMPSGEKNGEPLRFRCRVWCCLVNSLYCKMYTINC